jgi:dihydroorotase
MERSAMRDSPRISLRFTRRRSPFEEEFASLNGPKHYRLAPNEATITLEKSSWLAPEEVKVDGPDEKALVYRGGETIEWKVVNS